MRVCILNNLLALLSRVASMAFMNGCHLSSFIVGRKTMEKVCSIDPLNIGSQDASHTASLPPPNVGNNVAVNGLEHFLGLGSKTMGLTLFTAC